MSHWALDFASHAPDLPVVPWGGPRLGLSLWASIPLTLVVEGGLYLLGIWIYLGSTTARDRIGTWAFWIFLLLMLGLWASTPWSPPPPSIPALIWPSIVFEWAMIGWAAWVDRHRVATS